MTAARDSQRAKVYDAEQLVRRIFDTADESGSRQLQLLGSSVTVPVERKFASVESVAQYATKVLALNWIRARWPRATEPLHVRERAGHTAAHYDSASATIAVPAHRHNTAWALRELVVLHEIAHHLQAADSAEPAHGPEFVGRYVDLVSEIIGPEAGLVLRSTMAECGVRIG